MEKRKLRQARLIKCLKAVQLRREREAKLSVEERKKLRHERRIRRRQNRKLRRERIKKEIIKRRQERRARRTQRKLKLAAKRAQFKRKFRAMLRKSSRKHKCRMLREKIHHIKRKITFFAKKAKRISHAFKHLKKRGLPVYVLPTKKVTTTTPQSKPQTKVNLLTTSNSSKILISTTIFSLLSVLFLF